VGVSLSFVAPRFVTLAGSLTFALIPLMLIPNKYVFLAVFALVYLGRTLVDYSVPALLRAAIPVQIAGPYNAWRMLLHNGGTLLATTIAAFIPVTEVLAVVFLHEKFSSEKAIALVLSLWGLASYSYGEYVDAQANKKKTTSSEPQALPSPN
jgi:hypothetical protein